MKKYIPLAVVTFILVTITFACSVSPPPLIPPKNPRFESIKMPEGFHIDFFMEGVKNARSLCRGDNGTIFVSTRKEGSVYAIPDKNGDYIGDTLITIVEDLYMPNGVAFKDGSLYVAEVDKVWRYDNIEQKLDAIPEPTLISDDFPDDAHHGWKFIRFGPDGKLYIPVGAPCNICERLDNEKYASIMRMNPDGSELEVYAHGVRNSVGFDWHPNSKEMWFTDNGRDWMGDDMPPCELNHAPQKDMHFGYPYCHGVDITDDEFGAKRPCADFIQAAQALGPHVAPLGMRFYTGKMFPEMYRQQIFIAEHGSWNRSDKIGYRITLVKLDQNQQAIAYETFAEGWLDGGKVWGRPVDVLNMPDGSLLVSDDQLGAVYRISYQ